MTTITAALVRVAAPECKQPEAAAAALQAACVAAAFPLTRQAVAGLLAQLGHESGLNPLEENLNYSAAGIARTWDTRFASAAAAAHLAYNPEALANAVYSGRMGNTRPGDGWRYRGRGYIQITGRDMYRRTGRALGLDLEGNPELALTHSASAGAALSYLRERGLFDELARGDVLAVTRGINGGTNGLADRQARYDRLLAALPLQAPAPRVFLTTASGSRVLWDGRPTVYGSVGINAAWLTETQRRWPAPGEYLTGTTLRLTVAADGALILARA
ncbi:glycoside hydrolase family 19 protein [Deinococcus arenicola]|uniref:Glycoside hydrolase family 19 catalytic domain-containing protein n=1 Tax=Deinococcus arenicola TaxID=2994950 RepID=A0ABU4DV79_9DEIO|nr:hypothetical protein [Deinococcus sp. ZS9-10]MDV6376353.1 hypothetical protein [Deinococcus sp. ZS9-10]